MSALPPVIPLVTTTGPDQCHHCQHRWHGLPCNTYLGAGTSKCPCPTAWEEPA